MTDNDNTIQAGISPLVSERRLAQILGFPIDVLRDTAAHVDEFYHPFVSIKFKGIERKERPIDNPTGLLKAIQASIKDHLLASVVFPAEIVGGVRGCSPRSGARIHVRQPDVVTLDIRRFFRTVRPTQVAAGWQREFATGHDVTWLLTRLTTYQGYLPQGAPTSTALANIVFGPMADELRSLCTALSLRFTVYVDDIAISGPGARDAIDDAIRILSRHGFVASRRKVHAMSNGMRQKITGLVVNRKVSNGRERLRSLRHRARALEGCDQRDYARVRGGIAQATAACPSQGRALLGLLNRVTR